MSLENDDWGVSKFHQYSLYSLVWSQYFTWFCWIFDQFIYFSLQLLCRCVKIYYLLLLHNVWGIISYFHFYLFSLYLSLLPPYFLYLDFYFICYVSSCSDQLNIFMFLLHCLYFFNLRGQLLDNQENVILMIKLQLYGALCFSKIYSLEHESADFRVCLIIFQVFQFYFISFQFFFHTSR